MITRNVWVLGLVLALAAAGLSGGAGATTQEGGVDLDAVVETYNANVDGAPDVVRDLAGGSVVEARFGDGETRATKSTGDAYYFAVAEDGSVTEYGQGSSDDADIRVLTSEATVDEILAAEDPAAAFDRAYENGDIVITGVGITDTVTVELAKFAVWLGKLLGFL